MKTILFVFITLLLLLLAPVAAADLTAINGTWSGNWTPKGGVPDAITVELKADESGKIAGNLEPMIPRAKCGSSSGLSSAANGTWDSLAHIFSDSEPAVARVSTPASVGCVNALI